MQTFPAAPSSSSSPVGNVTRRGPYSYPYQGSYADPNTTQNPYMNPSNTTAAAMPVTTANASSTAAGMDAAKAERKRAHAAKLAQLAAIKDARDQAAANVAAMRAELQRSTGGGGGAGAFSAANTRMDEDVEAKSSEAKEANKKKKRSAVTSTDYLDFDEKFGGRTFNILSVILVVSALVLFYVLWFTEIVY